MPSNNLVEPPNDETKIESHPPTESKSEPVFIQFANFNFKNESLEDFLALLKRTGVEIPLEEFSLHYPPEDKEDIIGPQSLTGTAEENILEGLKLDQEKFRDLLSKLVRKEKKDERDRLHFFLDKGNHYCSDVPIQFAYHKEHPGKLDIAPPSIDIEEVGWENLILGVMAIDLGKYLMENRVTKIRLCKRDDCGRFFTRLAGQAIFCSDHCKKLFHYLLRRNSGYYRDKMKKGREKGKYQ